jgi:hypothetical protein
VCVSSYATAGTPSLFVLYPVAVRNRGTAYNDPCGCVQETDRTGRDRTFSCRFEIWRSAKYHFDFRRGPLRISIAPQGRIQLQKHWPSATKGHSYDGFQRPIVFPSGSVNHAKVPVGMSTGGTSVLPPSAVALSRYAFTSSTCT